MKTTKLLSTLALLCIAAFTNATVRTVSNNSNSPGQYTTVAAAILASSANDTIYISGSPIAYGDFTVTKALTLMGPGHHPAKQNPLTATAGIISISTGGVHLAGLTITTVIFTAANSGCSVQRCAISNQISSSTSSFTTTGLLISGCVFTGVINPNIVGNYAGATYGWTIKNNIFNGQISYMVADQGASFILNNIFIHSTSTFNAFVNSTTNCIINNNIFWATQPGGTGANCVMNNNISYSCTFCGFSAPGNNNLSNTDPQFVGYAASANFSYTQDFHLQETSPAKNNGTDFTDCGVYGGNTNVFSMTGEPAMPEIIAFSITSGNTVAQDGTLSISVTSKRIQ